MSKIPNETLCSISCVIFTQAKVPKLRLLSKKNTILLAFSKKKHDFNSNEAKLEQSFTIPLRESFALPFWAAQNAILTYYFSPGKKNDELYTGILAVISFLFAVCWQFNQFVFLLQACALYGAASLGLVPVTKVGLVYFFFVFRRTDVF